MKKLDLLTPPALGCGPDFETVSVIVTYDASEGSYQVSCQ
ncbi:MAG: hypothetical protein MAG431_01760 [Chloroflexi bacterium]|nr:hypothetical protein [Chloroflexota bacterium]